MISATIGGRIRRIYLEGNLLQTPRRVFGVFIAVLTSVWLAWSLPPNLPNRVITATVTFKMVRVEIAGKPILDLDYEPGESKVIKDRVRRTIRGSSVRSDRMQFSWSNISPRLVLTSDTSDFDQTTVDHFREEGFRVSYLVYGGNHKQYVEQLKHLADPLDLGDKYAIVGEELSPRRGYPTPS